MKKKMIFTIALVMAAAFSMPRYTFADNVNTGSPAVSTGSAATSGDATSTNGNAETPAVPASLSLSLDDALNLIEKGNTEIALMDKEISVYDKQYQRALAEQQVIKDHISDSMEEDDIKTLKLNVPIALYNLNNAKNDKEDKFKSLKVEITNEYESILAAQLNIDSINDQINSLKKTMDQVNLKIKLGLAKASDIEQYNAQLASLQASVSSNQRSIDSSMITFKNDLGISQSTQVTLTSKPLDYVKFDDSNLDARIKKAIDGSYDLVKQKQDIENTKIQYDIYNEYGDSQRDSTEISIEDKQDTLDNLPTTLEVGIRTSYNSLKSLENAVEAEKLNIESYEITLKTVQANYGVGQATELDVLNAQVNLSKEKNTLQQDINSYVQAVQSFKNSLNE